MSGGTFEYKQYTLKYLIEEMEDLLERLNKEPLEDNWESDSLKNYVKNKQVFKDIVNKNIKLLKESYIYTQRLDWFIAGDDGEESFHKNLEQELMEFNKDNMQC